VLQVVARFHKEHQLRVKLRVIFLRSEKGATSLVFTFRDRYRDQSGGAGTIRIPATHSIGFCTPMCPPLLQMVYEQVEGWQSQQGK